MDAERKPTGGFFSNLKITHKLTMVTAILLMGFAVIGAGYWFQQIKMGEVDQEEHTAFDILVQESHVSHDILTAQNALEEFLLTRNTELIQVYTDNLDRAKETVEELSQLVTKEEDRLLVQDLREDLNAYQVIGDELFTVQLQIGLTADAGELGAVRRAIDKLETFVQESLATVESNRGSKGKAKGNEFIPMQMEISLLTLLRHEKDFVESEDQKYVDLLNQEAMKFSSLLQQSAFGDEAKAEMGELLTVYQDHFKKLANSVQARRQSVLKLNEQQKDLDAELLLLEEHVENYFAEADARGEALQTWVNTLFIGILTGAAIIPVVAVIFFSASIRRSMGQLRQKILGMADGDASVAELLDSGEEFSSLGASFDALLVLRQAESDRLEQENEQINNSVIELMDAADRLSKRDLTVVAPVSEDITGNVSDALNLMARETARIMLDINQLAGQLEAAAGVVRQQGDKVADVAANERQVVAQALAKLEESAITMAEMAELAVSCDELGGNAAQSTKQALFSVRNTVQNINEIRNSVGETEKSIKRLGERSQEIGGIVEIIKDISERTHTLALNAGMQAVAAGEAGRGFSVVADEVQRLAETARESTDQIAALVQSIQAEASETMTIMNKTVSQVVEGSELAEKAGKRMRRTQRTTEELVAAVEKIADRSKSQVAINEDLRVNASALEQSTQATEQELREQTTQTENLFKYLSALVKSVRVFKLPDAA